MGFFRRKDSKAKKIEHHGVPTYDPQGAFTFSTDRLSDYSLKSPSLTTTSSSVRSTMVVSIPDIYIPPAPDPVTKPAQYLRSIYAVRDRSKIVLEKAKKNQLNHFDVDLSRFQDTADYVVSIIKVQDQCFTVQRSITHNSLA